MSFKFPLYIAVCRLLSVSCQYTKTRFFFSSWCWNSLKCRCRQEWTLAVFVLLPYARCRDVRKHFLLITGKGQYRKLSTVTERSQPGPIRSADASCDSQTNLSVVVLCLTIHIQTRIKHQHSQPTVLWPHMLMTSRPCVSVSFYYWFTLTWKPNWLIGLMSNSYGIKTSYFNW